MLSSQETLSIREGVFFAALTGSFIWLPQSRIVARRETTNKIPLRDSFEIPQK